jgi:HSP20 family molecular chaperone IbpA
MAYEILKRPRREAARASAESLSGAGDAALADADIHEGDDALFLRLDVPGVEKGRVSIEVDESNTLQIKARNAFREPAAGKGGILLREFRPTDYYRSFTLGEGFDKDRIAAKLEDGVLEITLPKLEAVKPKRIEISA